MRRMSLASYGGSSSPLERALINITGLILISFIMISCAGQPATPILTGHTTSANNPSFQLPSTNTASPTITKQPQPSPSPTPLPVSIWFPEYLPEKLTSSIYLPSGYSSSKTPGDAQAALVVGGGTLIPASYWIYTLVAPFPTIASDVTTSDLRSKLSGFSPAPFNELPLLMDQSTLQILSDFWGPPSPQSVKVLPTAELLDAAWSSQPSWAIVPFENLEPRWKVLSIDGQSPLQHDFDPAKYPLTIPFVLVGIAKLQPDQLNIPATNRDASRLTTVAMTGVTAMVRATAYTMELEGITYPAQDIGSLLAGADITHISNEIPFWPDCAYPESTMESLVFCSSPKYIDLLKAVGTDVIELTGDHFMDYGTEATLTTLQMYKDLKWPYFGGGADAEEARQPVLFENNGNKIAFMGCNIGCQVKTEIPCDAIATNSHPGAAQCDFDWISSEIPDLRQQGYNVIFTFQHREFYTYTTEPILAEDFGMVALAGATIVSGSQAHQPHGFAFENNAFIHYGLGNLFFDQYHYCVHNACDDAFIDRHVFYDGRYISTELIPIHFIDFARPLLMTAEEQSKFLALIFQASGW
jgi:poly-gamma-glutamate synthesis protein (capsule biosynthesis protein)